MSQETILYWWNLLCSEQRLGWSKDEQLLARTLGFKTAHQVRRRLMGDVRMTVREQRHAAEQIQRILSGRLQCHRMLVGDRIKAMAVVATDPEPLKVLAPTTAFVSIGMNGVKLSLKPVFQNDSAAMPGFKSLFN